MIRLREFKENHSTRSLRCLLPYMLDMEEEKRLWEAAGLSKIAVASPD